MSQASHRPIERRFDVVIIGGGIAGLWTLVRLAHAGYDVLLLEREALGAGQTIASQGIIHGGIKYTLGGDAGKEGGASGAIAAMPGVWRACLEGRGEGGVDLRSARVLSEEQFLWTTPGLGGVGSRLAGLGASKVIRTPVERVRAADRPRVFEGAPSGALGIDVYRVGEPVLAIDSVLAALAALPGVRGRIARAATPEGVRFAPDAGGGVVMEAHGPAGETVRIGARGWVLTAGAGNEALVRAIAPQTHAPMQRRPLHMVIARLGVPASDERYRLFGHCLGAVGTAAMSVPRMTVNSAVDAATGEQVWYLGGHLAESGVARDEPEQIEAARAELRACLPWLDLSRARLETFRIDRAEGVVGDRGKRPDGPVVVEAGPVIVGWPTKLALAPVLAENVLARLHAAGIEPRGTIGDNAGVGEVARALNGESGGVAIAPYPWTRVGDRGAGA